MTAYIFRLAVKCVQKFGWRLTFLNFGGGLGIVYSETNDRPLDILRPGRECADLAPKYRPELGDVRLLIESGRYLVGQAGQYFTPVVDIKESRGRKYLIVRNGLNGFLRPAIANLLRNWGPPADGRASFEPLFTAPDAFDFSLAGQDGDGPLERVSVVGNLCAATDVLAEDILLPRAAVGDLVRVSKAGSYAGSLSPLGFSSHQPPHHIFVDEHRTLTIE